MLERKILTPLWVEVQADKLQLVDAFRLQSCAGKPLCEDNHLLVNKQTWQRGQFSSWSGEPCTKETWSTSAVCHLCLLSPYLPPLNKHGKCMYTAQITWINTGDCQAIWPPGPWSQGLLRQYNLQIFMYKVGTIDLKKLIFNHKHTTRSTNLW